MQRANGIWHYVHKDLCNKTVIPWFNSHKMPTAVTSLCSPWICSLETGPSSKQWPGDWEFLTRGIGLKSATCTGGLQLCCINLYAHSAICIDRVQIAEWYHHWYVHKVLCNTACFSDAHRRQILLFLSFDFLASAVLWHTCTGQWSADRTHSNTAFCNLCKKLCLQICLKIIGWSQASIQHDSS